MNSLTFQKQRADRIIQNSRHDRKIFYSKNRIAFFGIFDEKFAISASRSKKYNYANGANYECSMQFIRVR